MMMSFFLLLCSSREEEECVYIANCQKFKAGTISHISCVLHVKIKYAITSHNTRLPLHVVNEVWGLKAYVPGKLYTVMVLGSSWSNMPGF